MINFIFLQTEALISQKKKNYGWRTKSALLNHLRTFQITPSYYYNNNNKVFTKRSLNCMKIKFYSNYIKYSCSINKIELHTN